MSRKDNMQSLVKEVTARFLGEEGNGTSLITVTNCLISEDMKRGTVFITVLPEDKENAAIGFAKRKRREIREVLKKSLNTKIVPFIDIEIDRGEKNRQKIDELLRGE
ncbi:MAG TPA: ribosome-binding factor A [Candidatus Paceibacterota bacterium]|nr:ribosome-binding factor A [Candidatus Paceibacterota bacterium]